MSRDSPGAPSIVGLQRIALLEGLSRDTLEAVARACAWRNFHRDQQIVSREAADGEVYFIVAGRVRVTTYSGSGREVAFRELGAGELIGDLAAIDGMPRSADVIALEDSLLASMPPTLFWRLLREHPAVNERLLRRLAALVRQLHERVIDLSTLGVQNRIQAELLRLAREAGIEGNAARLAPAPRHADIASRVSTYREQVTRELSALARQGLVERHGDALVLRDVALLPRMVDEVRHSA
jgi:CRP-like cAMP-binding protein